MIDVFLNIYYMLRDIVFAAYDIVMRRARRRYEHVQEVDASAAVLLSRFHSHEVRYEKEKIRVVERPIEPGSNRYQSETYVDGELLSSSVVERVETNDPYLLIYRFVEPEAAKPQNTYGDDDELILKLEPLGPDRTRLSYARELTHRTLATRITAPMGLRTSAWLEKTRVAETAPGGKKGAKKKQTIPRTVSSQLMWAALALGSFALIAGWQDALILMVLIGLHELGHAAAMQAVGVGVAFIRFVPFFGGMAAPKRHYTSEWHNTLVAWAGPGLSLIPTGLLFWFAYTTDNLFAANAAVLFAIVNGINLLPIAPLDGGVILRSLLGSIHPAFGQIVSWAGVAILATVGIYFKLLLMIPVVIFALIQAVYQSSLALETRRRSLNWQEGLGMLALFVVTLGIYIVAFSHTYSLRRNLDRFHRPPIVATRAAAIAPDKAVIEPKKSLPFCRLPATSEQILRHYLNFKKSIPETDGKVLQLLAAASAAGGAKEVESWLASLGGSKLRMQGFGEVTADDLRRLLRHVKISDGSEIVAFNRQIGASADGDAAARHRSRQRRAATIARILMMFERYPEASHVLTRTLGPAKGDAHYLNLLVAAEELERARSVYLDRKISRGGGAVRSLLDRLIETGQRDAAHQLVQAVLADKRHRPRPGTVRMATLINTQIRLDGVKAPIPAFDDSAWSWTQTAMHVNKAEALRSAGDTVKADALIDRVRQTMSHRIAGATEDVTDVNRKSREKYIDNTLESARLRRALDARDFAIATKIAETSKGHWRLLEVSNALERAGRLADAVRLREQAAERRSQSGKRPSKGMFRHLVGQRYDPNQMRRHLRNAKMAALLGEKTASDEFKLKSEYQMCRRRGALNGSRTGYWYLRHGYFIAAVNAGQLPKRVLRLMR